MNEPDIKARRLELEAEYDRCRSLANDQTEEGLDYHLKAAAVQRKLEELVDDPADWGLHLRTAFEHERLVDARRRELRGDPPKSLDEMLADIEAMMPNTSNN